MGKKGPTIIGLTGGIGAGKSSVAQYLRKRGFFVCDLDEEVRTLMQSSPSTQRYLKQAFGINILEPEQKAILRKEAFSNARVRKKLEAYFHPRVWKQFEKKSKSYPIAVCEAPLLFESGLFRQCPYRILVTAPKKDRLKRVQERNGLSRREIIQIMNTQWPDEKKRQWAHIEIRNTGNLEHLGHQIDILIPFFYPDEKNISH